MLSVLYIACMHIQNLLNLFLMDRLESLLTSAGADNMLVLQHFVSTSGSNTADPSIIIRRFMHKVAKLILLLVLIVESLYTLGAGLLVIDAIWYCLYQL